MRTTLARVCFALTCGITVVGVGLQLAQDLSGAWYATGEPPPSPPVGVWRFFSYFTTQSNLLVVAVTLGLVLDPLRDGRIWRVLRLNALTGIAITGLVHWALLRPDTPPVGLLGVSDTLVHVVTPLLTIGGWVAFGPRPRIDRRTIAGSFCWPVAWLAYTFVVGAATGWYPYFFLDVGESQAGVVAAYCAAILTLLLALCGVCWLGDRRLPGGRQPAAPRVVEDQSSG